MDHISDMSKWRFANLYKGNNPKKDRKEDFLNKRKSKIETLDYKRRNINVNMSPFVSDTPSGPSLKKNDVQKKANIEISRRLEMLAKWKETKANKKKLEMANKKPIFKVCHVPSDPCQMSKLEFAPANHKFRAPASIKPIIFPNNFNKQIKVLEGTKKTNIRPEKATSSTKPSRLELPKSKPSSQRQQEKKAEYNKTPKCKPLVKDIGACQLKPPIKKKTLFLPSGSDNSKLTATITKNQRTKATTSKGGSDGSKVAGRTRADITSKPAKLLTSSTSTCKNKVEPKETEKSPVYISPFVTISRGKQSARDEYRVRHSQSADPPEVTTEYFMEKLTSEIGRISNKCEEWDKDLHDPGLSEEARSTINAAVGQSNLFITKKCEQFRGLIVQCSENRHNEMVTCEDLHGFWDMLNIQVEDLDKRFADLDKLKRNNWTEMLPEQKVLIKKTRTRTTKKTGGASQIKDVIKAAREKLKTFNNPEVRTPLRECQASQIEVTSASAKRKSLRVSLLIGTTRKRCSSSPGLTMMRLSQSIKEAGGLTPGKSILKVDGSKSTGKKSVVFKNAPSPRNLKKSILFKEEDKENDSKSIDSDSTPLRRSVRLRK